MAKGASLQLPSFLPVEGVWRAHRGDWRRTRCHSFSNCRPEALRDSPEPCSAQGCCPRCGRTPRNMTLNDCHHQPRGALRSSDREQRPQKWEKMNPRCQSCRWGGWHSGCNAPCSAAEQPEPSGEGSGLVSTPCAHPAGLPVAPLCLRWALHLAQVSAP